MSTLLTDESRQPSNIESLSPTRDVSMALTNEVLSLGAVALRTFASSDASRLPTQVQNLDTALDMTTKKAHTMHDFTWSSVASLVSDMQAASNLQMTSRCSSASVGDPAEESGVEISKEKRPKPTNNHKKSYVWRHFRHPKKSSYFDEESVIEEDKSKTECIHCGAILAFNQSGTTTTMLNHLKSRHGDITAQEEERRREERQVNGSPKNKPPKATKPLKARKKPTSLQTGPISLKIKNETPHFLGGETTSLPVALNLSTSQIKVHGAHVSINNNNISASSNNATAMATEQSGNPEIPSPVSDGQTSGRASIGTAESSSALMVASPGSAGSDSTGPKRVKKRKRTASVDSQGNACTGPNPSSGAGSPQRSSDWDSVNHRVLSPQAMIQSPTTGRVLSYIVKDLNPPEALDSENFQNLLPGVKTCSSGDLRTTVMPLRVLEVEQQLKQRLTAPETTSAVAVECWDHHGALMASVGTQFLNQTGPCFRMLKTQEYCESLPLSKILSCLNYYELTKARFLPVVSNEAQTLRDEIENIQPDGSGHIVVLPCFTTILNKVLNDAVSYCSPIADLAPKLLDFAKPQTWQGEKWLYYYDAIVRVNRELILKGDAVLENQTIFTPDDIELMKSLTPILVQLCELSKKFNSLEPTASVVLPLVRHLVGNVLLPDEKKDGKIIAMFKQSARLQLEQNFLTNAKVTDTLALATLLDPRHKRNPLFEEDEKLRQRTMRNLKQLVAEEEARERESRRSDGNSTPMSKRARHESSSESPRPPPELDISAVFGEDCLEPPCQVSNYTNAPTWSLNAGSTNVQVMEWWRAHRDDFPTVARIAMRYFVIPANCAPAAIFSPAGPMAYRSRRALLQREDMNSLLFLHHNL